MQPLFSNAELFLNGKPVGHVRVRGGEASWRYGDFEPNEQFGEFAPVFGRWSLLMHADDDEQRLSEAASQELRQAEYAIDALCARLYWPEGRKWHEVAQLNIDGGLIEWKEK